MPCLFHPCLDIPLASDSELADTFWSLPKFSTENGEETLSAQTNGGAEKWISGRIPPGGSAKKCLVILHIQEKFRISSLDHQIRSLSFAMSKVWTSEFDRRFSRRVDELDQTV